MARVNRVRRRLLAQAVADNVATIRGIGPRRPSRWLGFAINSSKVFFFVALPLILMGFLYVLSRAIEGRAEAVIVGHPAPPVEQLASNAVVDSTRLKV
ncbi:MAG: hypothetical protein V3S30_10265, partial [Thermoanaerobaculia bacterium]